MAARIFTRKLSVLCRAPPGAKLIPKGYATAAIKFQDEDSADAKRKSTSGAPSAPLRARLPMGLFSEILPPLGRGASLLNMMDTMDDLFSSSSVPPNSASRSLHSPNRTAWDVIEDAKAFKLRLDMPGLSKEEVKVDVEEGNLVIKGEHKPEEGEDDWSARSVGSYNIRIKLPDNIKFESIKAELKNGVLRVTAPKLEETKKRLEVRVE